MGGGGGPLFLRENHLGHLWIKARGLWLLPSWHQAHGNAEWTVPVVGLQSPLTLQSSGLPLPCTRPARTLPFLVEVSFPKNPFGHHFPLGFQSLLSFSCRLPAVR